MVLKLRSRIIILGLTVCFFCACGGGGGVDDLPGLLDDQNNTNSGEISVACDVSEFSQSIIDEANFTENLSVSYSINYSSNFEFLGARAYIIPTQTATEADLVADVYEKYAIGDFGSNTDILGAKIDLTYNWELKEIVTKMTYKQAARDNRAVLNEEFQKAYLLIVGDIFEYVSPTEMIPHRTMCVSEIPLQKFAVVLP